MDILTRAANALKLQTEFDLRSGALRSVQLEQGRAPDGASDRQQIVQTVGSLRIADLGYFNVPVLKQIDQSKAYFLTRIQHNVKIFVDGVKHDLVTFLNAQELGVVDCRIELGVNERFGCRLIAYRVPEETANRRRQKLIATTKAKTRGQPTLRLSLVKVVEEIREFAREIARMLSNGGNLIATLARFCQSARMGCKLNRKKKKPGNLSLLRDPECLDYVLS